jgi:hypothetical protein
MTETPDYVPDWTNGVLLWNAKDLYEAGYVKNKEEWEAFVLDMQRECERFFTN